jgi:hypothetical protein
MNIHVQFGFNQRCSVKRSTFDKLTTDLEKIATKILGKIIKEN